MPAVDKLAIDVFLGTSFIDQSKLAVLPKERIVTTRDSTPLAIIEQENLPANVATMYKNTEKCRRRLFSRQKTILKRT